LADGKIATYWAKAGLKSALNFVVGAIAAPSFVMVGTIYRTVLHQARTIGLFQLFAARLRFPLRRGPALARTKAES
jgi:hypothetical protein